MATSHPNVVLKHLCLEKQVLSQPLDGSVLNMEECWTTRHQGQELMGHSPIPESFAAHCLDGGDIVIIGGGVWAVLNVSTI